MTIMRIIEEDKTLPATAPAVQVPPPSNAPTAEPEEKEDKPPKPRRRHRRHSIMGFCSAIIIMLALIFISLSYLIIIFVGPLMQAVDAVPADFPKDLAFYELDQAKIKVQSPAEKQRLTQVMSSLPEWFLEPFMSFFTADLKTEVAAKLKDPNLLPQNLSISDLEKSLMASDNQTKTVSLVWNDINKTKEDLVDYYKKQLAAAGFTVNEKLSDYEIDLSFFKPGIDGAMSVADSFVKDNNSVIKMTIDYLSKN